MATISGKRFQITDGASTPTNLFPYTVTEAVYGLSSVIENAKTAVTSVLSAVTLNGVSKAGTTASFYAPTTAGTAGQILTSLGSGAPAWTSVARGASNKPIYINSSGVLTEGVECLPLTGGTICSYSSYARLRFVTDATAAYIQAGTSDANSGNLYLSALNGGVGANLYLKFSNIYATGAYYTVYHSGNSNKSDVAWTASGFFTPNHGTHLTVGPDTWTYRTVLSSSWTSATGDYLDIGVPSSGSGNPSVIRLLGNGNVGIGTTSPGYKLEVNGTSGWTTRFISTNSVVYAANNDGYGFYIGSKQSSSANYLLDIRYGQTTLGSGGTSAFYVRADGNVGIGTTSPSYKLDVNGTVGCGAITSSGVLNITGATNYSQGIRIHDIDSVSSIWFRAVNASGFDAGMWGITAGDTGLRFRGPASTTATTPNDYVTIAHGGNVGVGTTTPGARLEVLNGESAGTAGHITAQFLSYSSNPYGIVFRGYSSGTHAIQVERKGTSTEFFSLALQHRGGNVGIGTTSPSQKLHVAGSILSTGDQVVSSDLTLKENLTPVTYSVSDIAKARAVEFDWRDGRGHSMGSIAQDWLSIAPALVHGEEGSMSLAYGQLALVNTIIEARTIESLQVHESEQDKEIRELRERVARLEMENERLRMN